MRDTLQEDHQPKWDLTDRPIVNVALWNVNTSQKYIETIAAMLAENIRGGTQRIAQGLARLGAPPARICSLDRFSFTEPSEDVSVISRAVKSWCWIEWMTCGGISL